MAKFVLARPTEPELADMYKFYCPACKECHWVAVGPRSVWPKDVRWSFNGNLDKPTISPSLLVTHKRPDGEHRCHSFIRDGKIQYLGDCTHDMKGQTIEIPEFPEDHLDD